MKQPTLEQRKEYLDIVEDSVSVVPIKGTKRSVRLRWIKPYTMERITKVWLERDLAAAKIKDGSDVLKDLAVEPYFAFREAALMILNNDIKIRLFYWIYWRWLAFRYNETQIAKVIEEGKKKLPLFSHYEIMVYSLDMRTDAIKMTTKEAEQYRVDLLSGAKPLLSKISQNTGDRGGGLDDGSAISGTGAS